MRALLLSLTVLVSACGGGSAAPINGGEIRSSTPQVKLLVADGDSLAAAATWPDAFPGRVNGGESGTDAADVLIRWDAKIQAHSPLVTGQPAVYVLVIGANDARKPGHNIEHTWEDLKSIWRKARDHGFVIVAATVHSSANPISPVTSAQAEAFRLDLNARMRSRPDLYDRLLELDLLFPNPADTTMLSDGLHFTTAADAVIAAELARIAPGLVGL